MYFKTLNDKLPMAVMVVMVILISCKKDFPPILKGGHSHSGEPVVLVAGFESNGTYNVAKYWVDGQEIKLSDGTRDASANSMAVSNNDVYIAGTDGGAVYWKNNSEIKLSGDGASSIFVSGNDIYVAGSVGSDTAVYWKNGTRVILDKNGTYGNFEDVTVNSIFVSGHDVYAAGYEGPNAVYWKNGKEIYLTAATIGNAGFIHATSIAVSGNDVYVVGYGVSPGGVFPQLEYWKSSVLVPFSKIDGGRRPNSIIVSGGDVYVAGMQQSAPGYGATAAYWKNGNAVVVPTSVGGTSANSIFVSNGNVYLAGDESVAYQMSYAVYWKDGIETKLTDGTHAADANAIVVK
jgi:hypothetical protein